MISTLLAALGHLLVDRFERKGNSEPLSAKSAELLRRGLEDVAAGRMVPYITPPQIRVPIKWHRVSPPTDTIPYAYCKVCLRAAPWEVGDACPGVES